MNVWNITYLKVKNLKAFIAGDNYQIFKDSSKKMEYMNIRPSTRNKLTNFNLTKTNLELIYKTQNKENV
jgi:hypothetical protein